jgi:hypothetical protein
MLDRNMPMADYLRLDALSSSWCIDAMTQCPAYAQYRALNREDSSAAMGMGTAFHTALMEPDKWVESVCVLEHEDYRSKAAKEARDAAIDAGRVPLKRSEAIEVLAMVRAVRFNPDAAALLKVPAMIEATFISDQRKARPDFLAEDGSFILDVKTCPDANPRAFERHAADQRYFMQAAFHRGVVAKIIGKKPRRHFFLAVERSAPYLSSVCELDQEAIKQGEILCDMAAEEWLKGRETGFYAGYKQSPISLPKWLMIQLGQNDPTAHFQAKPRAERVAPELMPPI